MVVLAATGHEHAMSQAWPQGLSVRGTRDTRSPAGEGRAASGDFLEAAASELELEE